jgi:hypothetical protein
MVLPLAAKRPAIGQFITIDLSQKLPRALSAPRTFMNGYPQRCHY